MFWTDRTQASERLNRSYVMKDGLPFYCSEVLEEDGEVKALGRSFDGSKSKVADTFHSLSDEGFGNFRQLPPLGWSNTYTDRGVIPTHLSRRSVVTRTHGLNRNNTLVSGLEQGVVSGSMSFNLDTIMRNAGYIETINRPDRFPALSDILLNCSENQSYAFSPTFCVYRDSNGLRWLYRHKDHIGFFAGVNTLSLFDKTAGFQEELRDTETFDIETIQSF